VHKVCLPTHSYPFLPSHLFLPFSTLLPFCIIVLYIYIFCLFFCVFFVYFFVYFFCLFFCLFFLFIFCVFFVYVFYYVFIYLFCLIGCVSYSSPVERLQAFPEGFGFNQKLNNWTYDGKREKSEERGKRAKKKDGYYNYNHINSYFSWVGFWIHLPATLQQHARRKQVYHHVRPECE
jgi:hypothetical protein